MKKLLFILSVVLALGSCSHKTLRSYGSNLPIITGTGITPMPGEFEPMISSEGGVVPTLSLTTTISNSSTTALRDTSWTEEGGDYVEIQAINVPQCHVDLQAVSIDPGTPWLTLRKKTFIQAVMKNNGPHVIPAGQATCHITINNRFLSFPYKYQFSSDHWMLVAVRRNVKGQVNLFFRNKSDMPVGTDTFLQFGVGGKAVGIADVTLASSLSKDASCGDTDGFNQAVRTEVIITK